MDFEAKCGKRGAGKGMTFKTSIVSLLLLISALQLLVLGGSANEGLDPKSSQPCSLRDALMDPTYENRYGVDVVWQIPPNPKAVLFLGHGGGSDPFGFFDPGPKCEQCYGLPEARTIVLEALRRGYAAIAVKSIGRRFDVRDVRIAKSEDLVIDTNIITEWAREHSLDGLPLAAWGQSSGTFIASALTSTLSMQALVLMTGDGDFEVNEVATPSTHPPTLFAYMPRDKDFPNMNITGLQEKAMAILTERGVRVTGTPCLPKPLSPLFFTERILCMSANMSRKIFAAYEAAGWLDRDGYLKMNPNAEDWKSVPNTEDWKSILLNANALPFCEASGDLCLVAHVKQELLMAFAMHSLTSDANDVIFPWLDSTINVPFSAKISSTTRCPRCSKLIIVDAEPLARNSNANSI